MSGEQTPRDDAAAGDRPDKTDQGTPPKDPVQRWNIESTPTPAAAECPAPAAGEMDRDAGSRSSGDATTAKGDQAWVRKEYDKLSPEAKAMITTMANTLFYGSNPEKLGTRIDPVDAEDVKAWWKGTGTLLRDGGSGHWNKVAEDRIREASQATERATFQPSWAFPNEDRDKREILQSSSELIEKIAKTRSGQVTFNVRTVSRMSVEQLRQVESSLQGLRTAQKVDRCKHLGYYDLARTDLDPKILQSVDTGKIPGYRSLGDIESSLKGVLDKATLEKLTNTAFDPYRQYAKNWAVLTTAYKTALKSETTSDADLQKEAESKVAPFRTKIRSEALLGFEDPNIFVWREATKLGDDLLQSLRSPDQDTYRAMHKVLDELDDSDHAGVVTAALLRDEGGATHQDLTKMLSSPHGGKELLVRFHDVLTAKNLMATAEERSAAAKTLMAMASISLSPGSAAKVIPLETGFLDGSYVSAERVDGGDIRLKMSSHVRAGHPDARFLPVEVFTTGIVLKPETVIGVRYYDEGAKSDVHYVPALFLLNLQKHSRDALFSNYFESAMIAATIATAGVGGLGVDAAVATRGARGLTTAARAWETTKRVGSVAAAIGDGAAMGIIGIGLVKKETRGWLIDTLGDDGRTLVRAVEDAEGAAGKYFIGRLAIGALSASVAKARDVWKNCNESPALRNLSASDRESFAQIGRHLDDLAKGEAPKSTAYADTVVPKPPEFRTTLTPSPHEPPPARAPRSPETRTTGPVVRFRDPRQTFAEFHPTRFEGSYRGYLGDSTFQRAQSLGMTADDLRYYIDRGLYWREMGLHHERPASVRSHVQRAARDDLATLESVGARAEIRQSIRYGMGPTELVDTIDKLRSRGFSNRQIRQDLHNRAKLIEDFIREFDIRSMRDVRASLRGNEGIEQAIRGEHWARQLLRWERERALHRALRLEHIDDAPGQARFARWDEEAREFARQRTSEFMGHPEPASGSGPAGPAPRRDVASGTGGTTPSRHGSMADDAATRPTVPPDDAATRPPVRPDDPALRPTVPPERAPARESPPTGDTKPTMDLSGKSDRLENRSEPDRFYLQDPAHRRLKANAHLEDGELCMTFRTKLDDGTRAKFLRGSEAFKEALKHFGDRVKAVRGSWTFGSNLEAFNRQVMMWLRPERAAWGTWTGQQAAAAGFTKVTIRDLQGVPGQYKKAVVVFSKP